jgi:hypothetical protein
VVPEELTEDICITALLCVVNDESIDFVVPEELTEDICITALLCVVVGNVVILVDFTEIGAFEWGDVVDVILLNSAIIVQLDDFVVLLYFIP